eukprot:100262_1
MSVEQIDKALGEYYKSVGRTDYFSNGTGLFMNYCEDNDFDYSYITEELKYDDVSESWLINFDTEFPLIPPIHGPVERHNQICRILKYCDDYKPPNYGSSRPINKYKIEEKK